MPDNSNLYPLKFEPIYKEKVWGGRRLERLGRDLPGGDDTQIGESWELADLGRTAVSGGGGGEARSVVANGPLAGSTLRDLIEQSGEDLLGHLPLNDFGEFPLLVKLLDANENLSVQVHPSPAYAKQHADAYLKSEAWYVLDAEPGAVIYKGLAHGVTADDVQQAIERNASAAEFEALLNAVPVSPGACHYLPSGTCHVLGAGVVVAEVQTPSDTTFRLYDWGRTSRELHVPQAIESIRTAAPSAETARHEKRTHISGMFTTMSRLVTCDHFRIEKVRMTEGYEQEIPYRQPVVWIVLEGGGRIEPVEGRGFEPVPFGAYQTLLLPANMPDAKVAIEADTAWLEVTFPQAEPGQLA